MLRALLALLTVSLPAAGCTEFNWRIPAAVAPPACLWLTVPAGTALQLLVGQTADLVITVAGGGRFDSSDFGVESITFTAPGRYRLEIMTVPASARAASAQLRARRLVRTTAAAWAAAEAAGEAAKRAPTDQATLAAITKWKATGNPLFVARAYLVAGSLATATSRPADEVAHYEEALRYCRQAADARCSAEAANNSGLAAMQLGRFDLSLQRLEEARRAWAVAAEPEMEARTISNLGLLNRRSGNLTQAIAFYNQARARIADPRSVPFARVQNNLGMCYLALNEYRQARRYFESAERVFQQAAHRREVILAQSNRGRTHLLEGSLVAGNLAQAVAILQAALKQAVLARERAAEVDVQLNLGQALLQQNDWDGARRILTEALQLSQSLKLRREQAGALQFLGTC